MSASNTRLAITALAFTLATLLGACGGGSDSAAPSAERPSTSSLPNKRALAVPITVDAKALFDWAEYKYPSLFPKGPQNFPLVYLNVSYTIRAYPNGNYLGLTTGGDIYGLGPVFTGGVLQSFGKLSDYVALVQGDACLVYPGSCDPPPPTGGNNGCFDPAVLALTAGYRAHLVYDVSGTGGTGEQTVDSEIVGPDTFESQSAIKITSLIRSALTLLNVTTNSLTRIDSFEQLAANGYVRMLGSVIESSDGSVVLPGMTDPTAFISKLVLNPPTLNLEIGLVLGQSVTVSTTNTITILQPAGLPPSSHASTLTHTYEARETIAVLGRSFNACRYRETEAGVSGVTTTWYLLGKGPVAVQIESRSGTDLQSFKLKSGTINGAAI